MRLIDADRIIERNSVIMQYEGKPVRVVSVIAINNAPTIEERTKGEWIEGEQDGMLLGLVPYYIYYCSECGYHFSLNRGSKKPNYCQECGADMRGEEHD